MKKKSRRKKSKSRSFSKILWSFIKRAVIFVLICSAAIGFVLYSPFFVLKHVELKGQKYLTVADVMKIANLYFDEPLFYLETDNVTRRLLGDLRIESAQVVRDLPNTLNIEIKERVPIATLVGENLYLDVDRNCKVLDAYRDLKSMPIPMITGIGIHDLYIGDEVEEKLLKKLVVYLNSIDEQTTAEISEIAFIDEDYVVAYTTRGIQIRIGKLERLEEKAKITEDFLKDLSQNPLDVEYLDLNYTSPYLKIIEY